MTRRTIHRGDVELAVYERGDAGRPTVLCVHGYPDDHTVWDGVAERLAERFHVVTYDVRGSGTSTAPHGRDAYRVAELRDDLAAVLDAVSPDAPVHLVGHDWGSVQAWEAVADVRLRSRLASFTSMSGPCLDHFGQWLAARRRLRPSDLRKLVSQLARSWYIGFFQLPVLPVLAARSGFLGAIVRVMQRIEGTPPARVRPGGARWGIEMYRANAHRARHPGHRRTTVPVQVVVAQRDAYITPALAEEAVNWASQAWCREIPTGHWAPRSHPGVIARLVGEFADHVDGAPPARGLARARVRAGRAAFDDRLVLVTGAGSGIGRATALAFAERGAEVVAVDIDAEAAQRTARLVGLVGPPGHDYAVDVSDGEAMAKLADAVRTAHGVPDIVVNNAGIAVAGPFLEVGLADWERIVDVNLWGVIHGTRLFGGQLAERGEGGHIVNIASAAAYAPSRVLSAYSVTKAAVLMLDQCVRPEFASYGVGVTTICPGFVATSITRTARFAGTGGAEQERLRRWSTRALGLRRYPPERVARRIVAAVLRDEAVVPVTPEARALAVLGRLSPAALRGLARAPLPPFGGRPSRANGAPR
ncbi:MAG TPA: SDR family oxidoreductase [Streptosporangiaceae bacterium]|jgi:NAD(P)-dependent dehydrogenase (short-subunit alcohol dehydrogenase family)/pimeloyl-ACP methyl ester carboxylesterase